MNNKCRFIMWSAANATKFAEDEEYWYDRERRKVDLTPEGTALVRDIAKPPEMDGVGLLEMYDFMERAIQVDRDYKLDRDYVVRDGEIVIVDEATGRISEGPPLESRHSSSDRSQRTSDDHDGHPHASQNHGAIFRQSLSQHRRHDWNRFHRRGGSSRKSTAWV